MNSCETKLLLLFISSLKKLSLESLGYGHEENPYEVLIGLSIGISQGKVGIRCIISCHNLWHSTYHAPEGISKLFNKIKYILIIKLFKLT